MPTPAIQQLQLVSNIRLEEQQRSFYSLTSLSSSLGFFLSIFPLPSFPPSLLFSSRFIRKTELFVWVAELPLPLPYHHVNTPNKITRCLKCHIEDKQGRELSSEQQQLILLLD